VAQDIRQGPTLGALVGNSASGRLSENFGGFSNEQVETIIPQTIHSEYIIYVCINLLFSVEGLLKSWPHCPFGLSIVNVVQLGACSECLSG
jgi:hypothetical protein